MIESTVSFGENMEDTLERKIIERASLRRLIEAAITCRPFASSGNTRSSDGVMYNFSSQGSYIETIGKYRTGNILIVRMVGCPYNSESMVAEVRPCSICLAEARWQQHLVDENAIGYSIGLKYLV
jgi:hypothetical protein